MVLLQPVVMSAQIRQITRTGWPTLVIGNRVVLIAVLGSPIAIREATDGMAALEDTAHGVRRSVMTSTVALVGGIAGGDAPAGRQRRQGGGHHPQRVSTQPR